MLLDWELLETNVTNERDYRSNGIIGGAERWSSRSFTVAAPRKEFSSSRSIMEWTTSRILDHRSGRFRGYRIGKVKSVYRANVKHDSVYHNNSQWVSYVSETAMCNNCSSICYPSEFFPNIQGNLTKITWAHGVNSLTELDKALASGRSLGIATHEARPGLPFVLRLLYLEKWRDKRRCSGYYRVFKYYSFTGNVWKISTRVSTRVASLKDSLNYI